MITWPQDLVLRHSYDSHILFVAGRLSDLGPKSVRLKPDGTNLGFNNILSSVHFGKLIIKRHIFVAVDDILTHSGPTSDSPDLCGDYFSADPPENCQVNVKKLPKNLTFFSKKLTKIVIFPTKLPIAILLKK